MKHAIVCAALLIGCAESATTSSVPTGNSELGIATFRVDDTAYKTTVTGLDASGTVVASLELVHGRFTLSPQFADDYATPEIDGRKLDVNVQGESMTWETGGYEPVLQLPPHPAHYGLLPEFLADPHVKPMLDRWGIGWANQGTETAYYTVTGTSYGSSPQTCDGATSCGTAYNGTINLCGGSGYPANHARRVTQTSGTNCGLYTSSYDQVMVQQCCPADATQITNWFARKACPTTTNNATECGTRSAGACKSCPSYPDPSRTCTLTTGTSIGSCGGAAVYPLTYSYNACGVWSEGCNVNADCCSGFWCDHHACNEL